MNSALTAPVDIIIPVYRGFEETVRCVEAAKRSLHQEGVGLVLVDDCSPEREISSYCIDQSKHEGIQLISNSVNMGFVASVNKAMCLSSIDVVLLNSDAIVSGDWIRRMQVAAYSQSNVASVTPLSNNATICTVPFIAKVYKNGPLAVEEIDLLAASINKNITIEVPTAVGYCMYISRRALDIVGFFDEGNFGKGYGEENDFCMRSKQNGFKHLMAQDIFVHHEGEVSFASESDERKQQAEKVLIGLHPRYPQELESYLQKNEAEPYKMRLLAEAQWQSFIKDLSAKKVVLHILGMDGGGSYQYVRSLAKETTDDISHFSLIVDDQHTFLQDLTTGAFFNLSKFSSNKELQSLLFEKLDIRNVHLHRFNSKTIELLDDINFSSICLYITYHDISFVKENIFEAVGAIDFQDISTQIDQGWLEQCKNIRESALASFFPSEYLKSLFKTVFKDIAKCYLLCPDSPSKVEPVNDLEKERIRTSIESVFNPANKTIAIIGALGKHKGFEFFDALKKLAARQHMQVNWVLIGYTEEVTGFFTEKNYIVNGAYEPACLPELLSLFNADLVYFPPGVPESYCYALSDVLRSSCPVVAHNLGALGERVGLAYGQKHVLEADLSVQDTADYLLSFKAEECSVKNPSNSLGLKEIYAKELIVGESTSINIESFSALQQQLQYFDVDQRPYRSELRRLSEVECYLNDQLTNARDEINSLEKLAKEREQWGISLQKNSKDWQLKLESDISQQAEAITKLSSDNTELNKSGAELRAKAENLTSELDYLKTQLHEARFPVKEILRILKVNLVRIVTERFKW